MVNDEWKVAEGVYIPKERDSHSLSQFRPISLLNVEGKVFFSVIASRLTEYVLSNKYMVTSIQKGGVPGCIEHSSMIWEGLYMPSLKAFMDDTTLVMNRRPAVQNTLDTFNSLLGLCRVAFKPAKSRSLTLVKGKIFSVVSFVVAGQRVPTLFEELVKSLGRVFNDSLTDKNQESD